VAAHREERAVLVHGDVHEWNALAAGDGYKLVDPDGLWAEPEYDVGAILREQPADRSASEVRERAAHLGQSLGLDGVGIWEWACVERLSSGLHLLELGLRDDAKRYLAGATEMAELEG
jgi:streptomycin 6-kinase